MRRRRASRSSDRAPRCSSCSATRCRRERWPSDAACRSCAAPRRPTSLDEARRLFFVAGRGRFDDDQSGRRRRRPRHARRLAHRRNRRSIQALPVGGARVVRQRRRVRRAVDAARASHRSADHRRRLGQRQPSVGARMQHPAPQSEDRRDSAEPGTRAGDSRSADGRRGADGEGSALRQPRHVRVSRQRRCVRER